MTVATATTMRTQAKRMRVKGEGRAGVAAGADLGAQLAAARLSAGGDVRMASDDDA